MQTYWLRDRSTCEVTLLDGDTVERVLGVELGYVEWCIRVDGAFENGGGRFGDSNNFNTEMVSLRAVAAIRTIDKQKKLT